MIKKSLSNRAVLRRGFDAPVRYPPAYRADTASHLSEQLGGLFACEGDANSDWCPGELKFASEQRDANRKPTRVSLLAVEGPDFTEDAIMGGNSVWMVANSRDARGNNVRKAMHTALL